MEDLDRRMANTTTDSAGGAGKGTAPCGCNTLLPSNISCPRPNLRGFASLVAVSRNRLRAGAGCDGGGRRREGEGGCGLPWICTVQIRGAWLTHA